MRLSLSARARSPQCCTRKNKNTPILTLNPSPSPQSKPKGVCVCVCVVCVCVGATVLLYQNAGAFPSPQSPAWTPAPPQSKPKGVCGCYSAAVSQCQGLLPHQTQSPRLGLKVCVGAAVLLYQNVKAFPQSTPKSVCVGAIVLLYQCQGFPAVKGERRVRVLQCCCITMSRPSPTLISLKVCVCVCVCGCYSAALSQCQSLPPPQSLKDSPQVHHKTPAPKSPCPSPKRWRSFWPFLAFISDPLLHLSDLSQLVMFTGILVAIVELPQI